jgi:PmbA protein
VLELLHETLDAARAAGADDAEVSHAARDLGMTRFATSRLTQAGVVVERTTRVRVAVGRRVGAATTSAATREALAEAARRALDNARQSPADPTFDGFARAGDARAPAGATGVYGATRDFGPAGRADLLGGVFARAARDDLECAGSFTTALRRRAVVTAAGLAVEHALTEATLSIIALDGEASGYAVWSGGDVARLDATALADEAVDRAVRARGPVDVEPGPQDVVLSPSAVSELLEWMTMASFSARPFLDGTSLLCGRQGEPVCDPAVSIVDDAGHAHPDAVAWPFDTEGTPRQRVAVIDAGRAGGPVSDRATAAKLGRSSTGHAAPFGMELGDEPVASNLVFLPGTDTTGELVGRVERGLYVTRFHYVNGLLDTRRATMTGMTRDGTFLIEDGRLGRAAVNLRFTESILEALGRVGGVGRELQSVPTHWLMAGNYLCPAVLVRGFTFTGRTR